MHKMAGALKVAVIGAGLAGLATARELQREGLEVVVYEKADQIGGTWIYNPKVETDSLGLDPHRKIVHSSLYKSTRTNLPTQLMSFSDYPFRRSKNGELTNFVGKEEVLKFLNDFASDFGLIKVVRFNTEVIRVEKLNLEENDQWVVESRRIGELNSEETFDAVVVCNGHSTQPRVADLPGIKKWSGKQIHSHNYRVPEPFQNQVVVVIGAGPSAQDIAQEIATVAKEVHLSSRSPEAKASKFETPNNLWQHLKIDYCHENGDVTFEDGATIAADVIVHCTGYKYDFPFIRSNGIIRIDDNRVGPLYKHVFPPQLAPGLSFVGLPNRIASFPLMELQGKWVAHVISGKVLLPSKEEMLADVEEHYKLMEQNGVPKHHTHTIPFNFEYLDWLAAQVGQPPLDKQLKEIYLKILIYIRNSCFEFREHVDTMIHRT